MDMERIIEAQSDLFDALRKFAAGEIEPAALKPFGAPFGIYQQRDGKFMNRVRLAGGEIPTFSLNFLAGLLRECGADYAHVTTRQNIQFHGVSALKTIDVVRACTSNGLPFRGGGGDTFRNISITADSGVALGGGFDLIPYARYLKEVIFDWEMAFHLPRKLKIGMASASDRGLALRQDLGFVAALDADGNPGFEVYGGGGFGRESAAGVKLFDFLPARNLAAAARAMIELFDEHGDRSNRGRARIRFIRKRIGDEAFVSLYREYYAKTDPAAYLELPEISADWPLGTLHKEFEAAPEPDDPEYRRWLKIAVRPTRFGDDTVQVTLFVPRGVLTPDEFAAVAALVEGFGVPAVRLTFEQNIVLPVLSKSALPHLYRELRSLPFDLAFRNFSGQIDCCIGATVCKIGVLDAPKYGELVAAALDRYFVEHPEERAEKAAKLIELLHFSGCPNSCTSHEVSLFGFQGCKKTIDGVLTDCFALWRNPEFPVSPIGAETGELIPAAKIGERVIELLREEKFLG